MSSTLRSCLKRDVVTVAEGRNLGRPVDILIDPRRHRASLVLLARGNVPDSSLLVAASAVRSFDTDTLAIESLDLLRIAATDQQALALLQAGIGFRGRPLIDSQGRKLGKIVRIVLDEQGAVIRYVARRGLLGWFKPRTKVQPAELGTSGGEMAVMHEAENAAAQERTLAGAASDESARDGEEAPEARTGSEDGERL